jgi:hypothetical protein
MDEINVQVLTGQNDRQHDKDIMEEKFITPNTAMEQLPSALKKYYDSDDISSTFVHELMKEAHEFGLSLLLPGTSPDHVPLYVTNSSRVRPFRSILLLFLVIRDMFIIFIVIAEAISDGNINEDSFSILAFTHGKLIGMMNIESRQFSRQLMSFIPEIKSSR